MKQTLQFVLEQSSQGHHHLFDAELIRSAFVDSPDVQSGLDEGTAEHAELLIDDLRTKQRLNAQRACIAKAPPRVQLVLVHLYFHYLDRFMHRNGVVYH